jgi:hypothetical protein
MTEKKAKTATPTPPGNAGTAAADIEHEEAIEDAGKYGKRVGAAFEKRMAASYAPLHCHKDPLNSAFLRAGCYTAASTRAACS